MHHSTHDLLSPVPGIARQLHSFHFGPRDGAKVYIRLRCTPTNCLACWWPGT